MTENIITASGTASEICEKLRILTAIFPKGATLAEVATATRYARIITAARKQFDEEKKD